MSKILIAPLEALTDESLSDQERRVLLALFSFRGRVGDVVYPGREILGQRANIKDLGRVSKCTSALKDKGWLTKWKTGMSGYITYKLTFPDRFNSSLTAAEKRIEKLVKLENESIVAESTTNGQQSILEDKPLGAEFATSKGQNLPCALNKPFNNPIKKYIYKKIILNPDDYLNDFYKEFIDHRINMKSQLTQNSFDRFVSAVKNCVLQLGVKPEWVITQVIDSGWKSCQPSWLENRLPKKPASKTTIRGRSIVDKLEDRSWCNG